MRDNFFVDSNILLYLLDLSGSRKKEIATSIIMENPIISPQVIFECLNVCIRKFKMERNLISLFLNELIRASFIRAETELTVNIALNIFNKYSLQPFDSKIIASALEADCRILYSEDMQHGLVIEKKLTIVKPFLSSI